MTIQPLSSRPREIGVTEPIEPAYERVKQMLFLPFDFSRWITLGFCAWLAGLGESGGGGSFNSGHNFNDHSDQSAEHFRRVYEHSKDYVLANLGWIVPVTILIVVAVLALWLLLLWLNSRGKFMFLHCVALNKAEVEIPWKKFSASANSLFRFRLVVGLIGMILIFPLLIAMAVIILGMILRSEPTIAGVILLLVLGLGMFILSLVLLLIRKFLVDFVVPIMFLRGGSCLSAWREFLGLLSANIGKFALYILFQIVLAIVIGAIELVAILLTCCVAGCLMLLPFVGTVLLLPVLVFKRAYPLYYFAQYGASYNVFPISPPPLAI